jgi:hypothetical protein
MKETFDEYLQRLKDRRTEDDYKYSDDDFEKYENYIANCWVQNLSVYKCLEFMYFEEINQESKPHNFLPGFVEQFDPKIGEIDGEEWSALQLLQWLELNKFKIVK